MQKKRTVTTLLCVFNQVFCVRCYVYFLCWAYFITLLGIMSNFGFEMLTLKKLPANMPPRCHAFACHADT